ASRRRVRPPRGWGRTRPGWSGSLSHATSHARRWAGGASAALESIPPEGSNNGVRACLRRIARLTSTWAATSRARRCALESIPQEVSNNGVRACLRRIARLTSALTLTLTAVVEVDVAVDVEPIVDLDLDPRSRCFDEDPEGIGGSTYKV